MALTVKKEIALHITRQLFAIAMSLNVVFDKSIPVLSQQKALSPCNVERRYVKHTDHF